MFSLYCVCLFPTALQELKVCRTDTYVIYPKHSKFMSIIIKDLSYTHTDKGRRGRPVGKQYHCHRNQPRECSLSVGALRGTHHFVLYQLPISRPGCGDTRHSRPQRTRRVPGRTDSPVRRLPAGDARNGKTFQTSHAHTAVRRKRHL